MFESVFRFFFKYERLVFEQGQFVLGATSSMWIVVLAAVAAGAYVLWTYGQVKALAGRSRLMLLAARTALLGVALFATLRPMLLLKVAVPQQNFVGILLDDSRSMQIADENGQARAEFIKRELGTPDAPLLTALGQRFVPRVFRYSSAAERLRTNADLTFQGTNTRVGDALDRVREEMSGLPVAGIIVVSDGADNAETTLDEPIAALKAEGMPVFTVGVGKDRLTRDVQVTRAEAPRTSLKGSSLVIDVVVTQTGYAGAKVPLVVEEDGRIVGTQDVVLPGDGESQTVKVRFKTGAAGPRSFRFKIPLQTGEEVTQNNQRDALIDVLDRRERVLLVDGEPRPEPKFILQATDRDDSLTAVLLQRTALATPNAPDKFWRDNVETPEELQNGFPTTRAELFKYRGVILGSYEAAGFTPDQQRLLEEFVDVRGGGLLALGGLRSFSEGGWVGTPLSNALPIALDGSARQPILPPLELVVSPTRQGQAHPATQIAETDQATAAKWKELPPLTAVNAAPVGALKPGATMLLSGTDQRGREQVVLAYQRYGRGKSLVMPVQDTWLWQMHARMSVEDMTHENFWQRLGRWLVDGVPERVSIQAAPDDVQRGEPVTLTAEIFNDEYKGIDDARVIAHVTSPSGRVEDVPMEWTVEQAGEYRARFTPTEDGVHRLSVDGRNKAGGDVGRGTSSLRVAPSQAEYFDAAMRAPLLQRAAEETGGRFFRAADVSSLVDAITYSGRGVTVVEERDLWDMPIVLFLLLGLMGGEWLFRRTRGLA